MACESSLVASCPQARVAYVSRKALWQRSWYRPFPGASCRTGRSSRSTKLPNLAPFQRLLSDSWLLLPRFRRASRSRFLRPLSKCFLIVFLCAPPSALPPHLAEEFPYFIARRDFFGHTESLQSTS